jgi:hypothetical protein
VETITKGELETVGQQWYDRLLAAQERVVEETVAPLRGRTRKIVRSFKEREAAGVVDFEVEVTITGGRIGYDDEFLLVGTLVHPVSGKLVETLIHVC